MMPLHHTATLLDEEKSIILTLLYFDIFQYPLTESEIASFSPVPFKGNWQTALATLTDKQVIYSLDGFYSLRNDPKWDFVCRTYAIGENNNFFRPAWCFHQAETYSRIIRFNKPNPVASGENTVRGITPMKSHVKSLTRPCAC